MGPHGFTAGEWQDQRRGDEQHAGQEQQVIQDAGQPPEQTSGGVR
jgi:hypothetical protein